MNLQLTVGLLLVEILIIGFFALMFHLCVKYDSRFGHLESTQYIWPHASKTLLTPPKYGFILSLVYGIGFNCLTRSLFYSVLQFMNVFRPNERLGLVGDFIVTCICTFVGSFAATTLYKFEEGSLAILFSVALAICVIPTGITSLIIDTELDSVGTWVLWVVSIAAFSLLASFIVFKFVTLSYSMLCNYSLEKFESQIPSSPEESTQESAQPEAAESDSTPEGSTKPNPTLKDLIDQGSTLEDVLKMLIETQKPRQPRKERNTCDSFSGCIVLFLILFLPTTLICGLIYAYTYGDGSGHETEEISYLVTVLINLTQLMDLMGYAVFTIYFQSGLVTVGASLTNWCWYVLITNLPCFLVKYLRDALSLYMTDEFLAVEILRVPFKLAAVGFIASAIYYILCLKKAKEILSAAEPQELDSFNVDGPETV